MEEPGAGVRKQAAIEGRRPGWQTASVGESFGTGKIAVKFADDLRHVPGAALTAVGSRSAETAEAFGRRFRILHRHATYAALVNDPDVDVVYISTPHSLHAENARLALEAGKAVLCEKAFTLNARQAAGLITLARQRRLFLMEAMWMRFLPAIVHVRQILLRRRSATFACSRPTSGCSSPSTRRVGCLPPNSGAERCSTWASTPCRWRRWSSDARPRSSARQRWAAPASTISPASSSATSGRDRLPVHGHGRKDSDGGGAHRDTGPPAPASPVLPNRRADAERPGPTKPILPPSADRQRAALRGPGGDGLPAPRAARKRRHAARRESGDHGDAGFDPGAVGTALPRRVAASRANPCG